MAQDFESLFKEVFGGPLSKLGEFQSEQLSKLTSRLQEIAREAVIEDLARLGTEVTELRNRLAVLEQERAQAAADSLGTSF
jgi:predicted nuclease with TOPRIM domain